MTAHTTSPPLADVAFLARAEHRYLALAALARRPQSRDDLLAITGVSRSTISRTLRAFEDRNWIRRDGHHYETTPAGTFVAHGMRELVDQLEIEHRLRDVWTWLPAEADGFDVRLVADMDVTVAATGNPYRPVNRFLELLEGTTRFRFVGFDLALLEPCRDRLCERIRAGMETEIIDPPEVVQHIRSTYPDQFAAALESGNLTVWLHHDLPSFGVGIFDDRIAITSYEPDTGAVQALLESEADEAREWAMATFRSYRRERPTLAVASAT